MADGEKKTYPTGGIVLVPVLSPHFEHPPAMAMTVMVSAADQAHIDAMLARSYQLALDRQHIRR